MTAATTTARPAERRPRLSPAVKRGIGVGVVVLLLVAMFLGTKIVPADSELAQGAVQFDPASYGAEQFPVQQAYIEENAVDAVDLADAIVADPAAAAEEYGTAVNGGASTIVPVTFTGVVGDITSPYTPVTVEGMPEGFGIGLQLGPAINGTELRDVTGDIRLGDFENQIEFQDAASAINDQLKAELTELDVASLAGKMVTVEGAFTLINPKQWNVTPATITVGG